MKLVGLISAAFLSLTLGVSAPVFAQEQHDQQEEQKDKPAEQKDQKTQPEKPAKQEEKTAQQDKNANQEEKTAQQQQHTSQAKPAQHGGGGRIPDDRYQRSFWTGTQVSRHPSQLPQSPLPIWGLLVRIC